MNRLEKIDENFFVTRNIDTTRFSVCNSTDYPFKIHGLLLPDEEENYFKRVPCSVSNEISSGVEYLNRHTAGGRVRFKTNSSSVSIIASMDAIEKMPHFALTGSAGFDLYADNMYRGTFVPPYDIENGYSGIIDLGSRELRQIQINFPLYSGVNALHICVEKDSVLEPADEYLSKYPIVYYGSSITQGGCASRPGNTYQEIISRKYKLDYINLGFSGSAKGEEKMAEYISELPMDIFVYGYDANADSAQHLENTHKKMFDIIRSKNPELPIVMISYPNVYLNSELLKRRQVIEKTYLCALKNGDKNVYYIDGCKMMSEYTDDNSTTVDNCHPNDYGFRVMASKIGEVIEQIINIRKGNSVESKKF